MGYEQEAVDELWSKVWGHKSAMQRDLTRGAHGEVFALRQLMEYGQLTPSQLASALRVSSGRVSTLLSALERKGFVTRENDPDDRRVVRVRLTDAGREAVRRDVDAMRDAVCWIFSQMGERRTREFVDLTCEFMTYMSICRPGKPRPTPEEVRKAFDQADSQGGWSCPVAGAAAGEDVGGAANGAADEAAGGPTGGAVNGAADGPAGGVEKR